jgi:hypothetical protein
MTALMYEDRTAEQAAASTIDELQTLFSAADDRRCDDDCSYCWGPETD